MHNQAIKVVPAPWAYTGRPCQGAAYGSRFPNIGRYYPMASHSLSLKPQSQNQPMTLKHRLAILAQQTGPK